MNMKIIPPNGNTSTNMKKPSHTSNDDMAVDAIKDYETEIIKISALPAVRPSCGHSVVLATNIITVMELLCSVIELNFSSVKLKC